MLLLLTDHFEDLKYPLTLRQCGDGRLNDIWSGKVLQSETKPGRFFAYSEHLALSLSTDGVPLFKSSTVSLWPVYLIVNNLPPRIRMNSENVILCAMWCGPGKPPVHCLLKPIMEMMKTLSTIGITLQTPDGIRTIRAKLLLGVFDMPAKAIVLNAKQFNGEYGCSTCFHPGLRLPNGSRIYLPNASIEQRTNETMIRDAQEAEENGCPEFGVKGSSVLSATIDLVKGVPVDYMHAVLEGITRWLLKAWVDSLNHREPYYVGRHLSAIDTVLLQQQPLHEFSRPPRAIKTHMK